MRKMLIGIYNLEPKIVNSALMQVWNYHKLQGDIVEFYNKEKHSAYDLIYAFSLFIFTDKSGVTPDMICGGTGFDIEVRTGTDGKAFLVYRPVSELLPEIVDSGYCYDPYPPSHLCWNKKEPYSLIWFSRGCINDCPWCIVSQKEGHIHSVEPKNLNPDGRYIKVMDNSFFANPKWHEAVEQLKAWKQPVDLQGVDIRTMNQEKYIALGGLRHRKQIKIAWDNPNEDMFPYLEEAISYIPNYKLMCYVLIGYNSTPEQDQRRVEILRSLDIDPFVMKYNPKDRYQMDYARYVNQKAVFNKIPWKEYNKKITNIRLKKSNA